MARIGSQKQQFEFPMLAPELREDRKHLLDTYMTGIDSVFGGQPSAFYCGSLQNLLDHSGIDPHQRITERGKKAWR